MINNLKDKTSQILTAIQSMINAENTLTGLLSDVEAVYIGDKTTFNEYPCIWVVEERLEPRESGIGPKSIEIDSLTVAFYCIDFDLDTPENSYLLSKDLAVRVADTLEKYCLITDTVTGEKVFDYVKFVSLEPTGNPSGSAKSVSVACLRFEFGFRRQRTFCNLTMNNSEDD